MRVSINKADVSGFLYEYLHCKDTIWKDVKINKLICAFETKDKEGDEQGLSNPHIHLHILYEMPPTKQNLSAFMKKFKDKCPHDGQMYYHKKSKDAKKSLAYTIKDGDIIMNKGYTDEELEEADDRNLNIDKDKKSASFMKIANRIREDKTMYGNTDASDVMKYIFKLYTKEFKSELSMSRCKSLTYQVFIELGYMDKQFEDSLFSY